MVCAQPECDSPTLISMRRAAGLLPRVAAECWLADVFAQGRVNPTRSSRMTVARVFHLKPFQIL